MTWNLNHEVKFKWHTWIPVVRRQWSAVNNYEWVEWRRLAVGVTGAFAPTESLNHTFKSRLFLTSSQLRRRPCEYSTYRSRPTNSKNKNEALQDSSISTVHLLPPKARTVDKPERLDGYTLEWTSTLAPAFDMQGWKCKLPLSDQQLSGIHLWDPLAKMLIVYLL